MVDLCFALAFMGAFCLVLFVGYIIFGMFMFVVYKMDNGKLNFIQYMKRWK